MFIVEVKRIITVILGSFLLAISLNFFLIDANVYASGFTGVAQLISSIFHDFLNIDMSTGLLLLALNIPVFKASNKSPVYSVISVAFATVFLEILPIYSVT